MVSLESVVLLATGTVASIFTIVPYSIARTDSVLPSDFAIYLGVVAVRWCSRWPPASAPPVGRSGLRRSRR
jgi:hypothetical protein